MNTLKPVIDGVLMRLGTFLAALLLGYGLHADHVQLLVPAILVVVGVGVDMIATRLFNLTQRRSK